MSRPAETPKSPLSGILALVDELLLTVIDQIESRESLCNLAATCLRFQGLVEPYIWRSLLVTNGAHAQGVGGALDSREARISYIHELSIRYPHDDRQGIEHLNHFVGMMDRLRHLTIESSCPNNTEWNDVPYFDGWTRIDYRGLLEAAVYTRFGMPLALQMLQSLTLHGHGPEERKFIFGRCAVMFFHPSLRRITLSCTNFDADITQATIPPERRKSTPLQSLTLIECNVNVNFLDVVLSLPKALKELDIGERLHPFPECFPHPDQTTRTSHPLFIDALAQQADSLERLSHLSGNTEYLTVRETGQSGQSSFSDLIRLKYLELGMESSLWSYLEQSDYPGSLQKLKATDTAWINATPHTSPVDPSFLHHPWRVLRRCTEVFSRMARPVDIDIRFHQERCAFLLRTLAKGHISAVLPTLLGGPVRSPVYKLSSAVRSQGCRLRLFNHQFTSEKTFIPPYMYGEEEPEEVQFYDSEHFWRFGSINFRPVDDENFQAEMLKGPRQVCLQCVRKNRECFQSGEGTACVHCETDGESADCTYGTVS